MPDITPPTAVTLCRRLVIHGHVQGVGFRWSLRAEAIRLGLRGWVCNRRDGCVEAMLCGEPDAVAALTDWAHRGPPAAIVERVGDTDLPATAACELAAEFEERPTF